MEGTSHFIRIVTRVLFLHIFLVESHTTVTNITVDQSALLALKTRVIFDPYGVLENWTVSSSSVCDWIGVTCGSRHHRVRTLNVSYMGLTGDVPPEFGNLSFLVSLDMRSNYFSGILPQELARLRRLRFITLSQNNFTGEVPSWFAFLPQLQFLSLSNNSFTSLNLFLHSFPNDTKLDTLDVSFNSLQGNIPESIGNLLKLKALSMKGNRLSGFIPFSLVNMSSLEKLDLSHNTIQGMIPGGIGNLHNLNWLIMGHNQLTGSIPFNIFNISTLEEVSFTNNSLSGTLRDDMCLRLPLLKGLYLSENEIHGQIPSSVSACSQLQILSLSGNNFVGTIPPAIENLEMLEELYLGHNKLTGEIPFDIGKLHNLQFLAMERNMLRGSIPSSLFNMSSLQVLSFTQNKLIGSLVEDFGNLTMLKELYLGDNDFTGVIPQSFTEYTELETLALETNSLSGSIRYSSIFNISTLKTISLTYNKLSGTLPSNIGYLLPNLESLYLGGNNIDGVLPNSISNCSELVHLDVSENNFMGSVPYSLGELRLLQVLDLEANNFTSISKFSELRFITSLTNCRNLRMLGISYNPLNGNLPRSLGNLSSSLEYVAVSGCKIKGHIPNEIGNLSGLVTLDLSWNILVGFIPKKLHDLTGLQQLDLSGNQMRGYIPRNICKLKNLGAMNLEQNQLTGSIPDCLGNVSSLREINLNSNNLTCGLPASIWKLQDLLQLDLSSNSFTGSLSLLIGNLKKIAYLNLSVNQFANDIPNTFEGLQGLINFSLAHNRFQGSIPKSIGRMLNLVSLDLSHNNLSGMIPKSLEALSQLDYFNASFNQLSGEIPSGGPFKNFTSRSFLSNAALCGLPKYKVSPCKELLHRSKLKKLLLSILLPLGVAASMFIMVWGLITFRYRKENKPPTESDISPIAILARISYHDLLQATNGYSESNLLGEGSFGSVYKGVFRDGTILAIKVFKMQLEGALKSFDAECEVLRNLRHRNLTKVITSCSNLDFKAIVLEYMPNGSLEKWLYSENCFLNTMQRLNIMIDVASALEYLHHGYSTPVIHCDLKPSNVLIDESLIAHVSDFGIAKLLTEDKSITHTRTLATMGYMAPEYGLEGMVSTRCDVYSYGIMVLETFTGKKPSDAMFCGDSNLKNWVLCSLHNNAMSEVIDCKLIRPEEENFGEMMCCIASVLELALRCSSDDPRNRMNMKDVLVELKKTRLQFIQRGKLRNDAGDRTVIYGNAGTS